MNKFYKLRNKILEYFEDKSFDVKYFGEEAVDIVRYWWKKWIVGGITLIVLLWSFTGWLALEKENILVTRAGNKIVNTKTAEANKDLYFIYTDTITYKMEDNSFYLRWKTADDYGKIKEDHCYTIWSLGMRIGMLDWYENIIYSEEIDCKFR